VTAEDSVGSRKEHVFGIADRVGVWIGREREERKEKRGEDGEQYQKKKKNRVNCVLA
jgi:hypothetical protein